MKKLALLFAAITIISCNSSQTSSQSGDSTKMSDSVKADTPKVIANKSKNVSDINSSTIWKYETDTDKMTSKLKYFAVANSTNTLNFDSPYDGGSTATITLRNQNKENEVILSIDKGQFICNAADGCVIKVRFDKDPAITYSGSEPSDYSSTSVFISPGPRFISHAKKAKKMIVQAEFYQSGLQEMEFNVDGLKWAH